MSTDHVGTKVNDTTAMPDDKGSGVESPPGADNVPDVPAETKAEPALTEAQLRRRERYETYVANCIKRDVKPVGSGKYNRYSRRYGDGTQPAKGESPSPGSSDPASSASAPKANASKALNQAIERLINELVKEGDPRSKAAIRKELRAMKPSTATEAKGAPPSAPPAADTVAPKATADALLGAAAAVTTPVRRDPHPRSSPADGGGPSGPCGKCKATPCVCCTVCHKPPTQCKCKPVVVPPCGTCGSAPCVCPAPVTLSPAYAALASGPKAAWPPALKHLYTQVLQLVMLQQTIGKMNYPVDQLQKARSLGLRAVQDDTVSLNSHALQALVRQHATVRAIQAALMAGHDHFVDFWGSSRSKSVFRAFDSALSKAGFANARSWAIVGECHTPKDFADSARVEWETLGSPLANLATWGFICDVYVMQDRQDAASLWRNLTTNYAPNVEGFTSLHHVFSGAAGTSPGYVWYRQGSQVTSIFGTEGTYIDNDPLSWWDADGCDGPFSWITDKVLTLGPGVRYQTTKFKHNPGFNAVPRLSPCPAASYSFVPVPLWIQYMRTPTWMNIPGLIRQTHMECLVRLVRPPEWVILPQHCIDLVVLAYAHRNINQYSWADMLAKATDTVNSSSLDRQIWDGCRMSPAVVAAVVAHLAYEQLRDTKYSQRQVMNEDIYAVQHGQTTGLFIQETPSLWSRIPRPVKITIGLGVAYCGYRVGRTLFSIPGVGTAFRHLVLPRWINRRLPTAAGTMLLTGSGLIDPAQAVDGSILALPGTPFSRVFAACRVVNSYVEPCVGRALSWCGGRVCSPLSLGEPVDFSCEAGFFSNMVISTVVNGPLLEESCKRFPLAIGTITRFGIPLYEALRQALVDPESNFFAELIWRTALHETCARLPLGYGLIVHSAWNAVVMCHFGSGPALPAMTVGLLPLLAMMAFGSFTVYMREQNESASEIEQFVHSQVGVSRPISSSAIPLISAPPLAPADLRTASDRTLLYEKEPVYNEREAARILGGQTPLFNGQTYWTLSFNGPSVWTPPSKEDDYQHTLLMLTKLGKRLLNHYGTEVRPRPYEWSTYGTVALTRMLKLVDPIQGSWDDQFAGWVQHQRDQGKFDKYKSLIPVHVSLIKRDRALITATATIQIMSKKDEVLLLKCSNSKGRVPRPIDNVQPLAALVTGPLDWAVTNCLKRPGDHDDKWATFELLRGFYWFPALGWTEGDLSDSLEFCRHRNCLALYAHGDDAAFFRFVDGDVFALEIDLSSCDRSLTGPALEAEERFIHDVLLMSGQKDERWKVAEWAAARLSRARRKCGKWEMTFGKGDGQRPTGCTRTSLMNTVLASVPYVSAILRGIDLFNLDLVRIQDYFLTFGLVVKVKLHHGTKQQPPLCTFLKGVWLRDTEDRLTWVRLPSLALKFFKSRQPPAVLTRLTRREIVPAAEASRRFWIMGAKSWRPYTHVWGLREFMDKWAAYDMEFPFSDLKKTYRVQQASYERIIDAEQTLLLAAHYQCPPSMLEDWLAELVHLEPGALSNHPVWMLLGRDYS